MDEDYTEAMEACHEVLLEPNDRTEVRIYSACNERDDLDKPKPVINLSEVRDYGTYY